MPVNSSAPALAQRPKSGSCSATAANMCCATGPPPAAFYSDCEHEVLPVESGARVTLTYSLRAELPNPKGELLPGLFVKVRLVQASSENAIRLPQQSVTRGPLGDSVLVVGADNKPVPRKISVGPSQGTDWVVLGGLQAGEKVIVDGFQKLAMAPPGTPVNPVPWTARPAMAPQAAPSAVAASSAASR